MADTFSVILTRTASTSLPVGSINADAGSPEIGKLRYLSFGCSATPADYMFVLRVQRCTTAGTGVDVTPTDISTAGSATASTDCKQAHTVTAALTSGKILLEVPVHQRATYQFYASTNYELAWPATASNGLALLTPVGPASVVLVTALFVEGT